ncbi:MAG: polyprenyl synthetase family protein [Catalinimonas sp.]
MFDLTAARARLQAEIAALRFGEEPPELYEPIRYLMNVGGKRLRPLLTLLGYQLYAGDWPRALRPAVAVEVFHNFTLMHDDIMDQAPLRRGLPTVHARWNPNVAILSGDVMLVKAYELMMDAPDALLRPVLVGFNRCAADVCEGQQHDMNFETRADVGEAAYLRMIKQKTAALLGFALELGGTLAGADTDDRQRLYELGIQTGLGFQLMDDLLDVYGDQRKFGKQVGGDIIANKKTLMLIRALAQADADQRAVLNRWLRAADFNPAAKVQAVRGVYDALDLRAQTQALADEHFGRGLAALDALDAPNDRKQVLRGLILQLTGREQ